MLVDLNFFLHLSLLHFFQLMLYVMYLKTRCRCFIMNHFVFGLHTFTSLLPSSSVWWVPVKLSQISQKQYTHPSHRFWYQCHALQTNFCLKKIYEKSHTLCFSCKHTAMWEKSCYFFLGSFWLDLALLSPKIVGNMLIINASLKILRAHCWEPWTWIILKYWDKFCICCLTRSTMRCPVKIDLW